MPIGTPQTHKLGIVVEIFRHVDSAMTWGLETSFRKLRKYSKKAKRTLVRITISITYLTAVLINDTLEHYYKSLIVS